MDTTISFKKKPSKKFVYELLNKAYKDFNTYDAISCEFPDPLGVARIYKDERVALFCALFSYGNARAIVKFLQSCDLESLKNREKKEVTKKPYRFQKIEEIQAFFEVLCEIESLKEIFLQGYKKDILSGINALQSELLKEVSKKIQISQGLEFLLGKVESHSPLKRWNMFLRWLVRKDALDLGLWSEVDTKDLLLPLDTHTFKMSLQLGIIKRKTYDFKAVLEATEFLRKIDSKDPIKYDFALYRIGQLKLLEI